MTTRPRSVTLPAERLDVLIDGAGDDPRRITLRPGHHDYVRYLDSAAFWVFTRSKGLWSQQGGTLGGSCRDG